MHENHAVAHRGHLLARRSARRRRAGGGVPPRLPLRQLGRRAARRAVGSRDRRDRGAHRRRHRALHGHAAGDGAAALGPHRHRPRARLPGARSTGRRSRIGCRPRAASRSSSCCTRAASPPPRHAAADKLVCYDCGVACDLDAMKEERLFFLRRMNAWLPQRRRSRRARAIAASRDRREAGQAAHDRRRRCARRRGRPTATGCATRSSVASPTSATWIWCATCRASSGGPGCELFYSDGFHPKPELSFGPALGLGIPSLGELVDVTLIEDVTPDELLRRLARRHAGRHRVPRGGAARPRRSRRSAA